MVSFELPAEKRAVLEDTVAALIAVRGVLAIGLGGSFARGTQRPDSDLDVGLYYSEGAPFAIDGIRHVAERIAVAKPVVTDFYEWGPWVNGGAWIPTRAGKLDFLYRNVEQVRRAIVDARAGKVALDFRQQPPFGFHNVIYLAETDAVVPLHDPDGVLKSLKRSAARYPAALRRTIIADYLWGAEFTLLFARDFAGRADVYNVVGCLTRGLSYLTQVLFALNETYFIADKGALETISQFAVKPDAYADRVRCILARPGATAAELRETVGGLESLVRDVLALAGPRYRPKYDL